MDVNVLNRIIAKICHESVQSFKEGTSGEKNLPSWEEMTESYRLKMITFVEMKTGRNNDTAEELHNVWMAEKLKDGWKYGETLNETDKMHPNLLPYSMLPETEQFQDVLKNFICQAFLDRWQKLINV